MNVLVKAGGLFLICSFLGWCLEAAAVSVRKKSFVNKGVLNGPLCPVYGITFLIVLAVTKDLQDNWFFLLLGCMVLATVAEFLTGKFLEHIYGRKWWDYSQRKCQYEGYVCLGNSLLWGILGLVGVKFLAPFFLKLLEMIPSVIRTPLVLILLAIAVLDAIETFAVALRWKKTEGMENLGGNLERISSRLGAGIFSYTKKRLLKAYPNSSYSQAPSLLGKGAAVFAEGCNFYKLAWLFLIGAFLGDLVETVFCFLTSGVLMSRSSVVYGPFSIVWGLAVVLLTGLLYRFREKEDRYLFLAGTVLGGAYEYVCSVFTEKVFGAVFWDYSGIPFNLGGRINLLYCFFWGIAALVWMKVCYPPLSRLIEKIPIKAGKALTWVLVSLMIVNMAVSAAALGRYTARTAGVAPANQIEIILDEHFPDQRMERIYPNAVVKR